MFTPRVTHVLAAVLSLTAVGGALAPLASAQDAPAARTSRDAVLSHRLKVVNEHPGTSVAKLARLNSLAPTGPGSLMRRDSTHYVVEIRVTKVSSGVAADLARRGAVITGQSQAQRVYTAAVAADRLDDVAALPAVEYVGEVLVPMSNGCDTLISAGDSALKASDLRSAAGLTGLGTEVGILADTFGQNAGAATQPNDDVTADNLPGALNTCDHLSPVHVLTESGATTQTDAGRAMAQIVHDLAPDSTLSFATGHGGQQAMADNITALAAHGAKVIADDITYFEEPFFQRGVIGNAIAAATAAGVTYFSSAGDNNSQFGGQDVGSYETGAFRQTACPVGGALGGGAAAGCHDFSTNGSGDAVFDFTLKANRSLGIDLQWAQPLHGVTTDLNLYLLNAAGTLITGSSVNDNISSQQPYEFLTIPAAAVDQPIRLVIGRKTGPAARFKMIFVGGGTDPFSSMQATTSPDVAGPTIFGHNGGAETISVAAAAADVTPTAVDNYSSRGPVTLRFGPVNGTTAAAPITPAVLNKPDITASDCVANSFLGSAASGVHTFCGTSAAAPHAAAVAALLRQKNPGLTPAQIKTALTSTAVSLGAPARTQGAGLINALAAAASVTGAQSITFPQPTTPVAPLSTATMTATASSGLPITYSIDPTSDPGVCDVAVDVVTYHLPGTCVINADQPGNTTFPAAAQVQNAVTVSPPTTQTITFPQPPTPAGTGTTRTLTATASSGLPIAYTIDPASGAGVCSVTGSTVTYTLPGACVINADQAGNAAFLAATQVQRTVTVQATGTTPQTIAFTPTATRRTGTTETLDATASSGLPVRYTLAPGTTECSLSGITVSYASAGTCVIVAQQDGDTTYAPAPTASRTVHLKQAQTITFPAPAGPVAVGANATLTATASSGLPVTFLDDGTGTCDVTGNSVSFHNPGSCVITAVQAGNSTYAPATPVSRTVVISAGGLTPQAITFSLPDTAAPGTSAPLTAVADSGLPVDYVLTSPGANVCSATGDSTTGDATVHFLTVGICTVRVLQNGDSTYAPAVPVDRTVNVTTLTPQSITFPQPGPAAADTRATLTATASSGLPVSYTIDPSSEFGACEVSGSTIRYLAVATCVINAEQPGNNAFAPATRVQRTVAIAAAPVLTPQTISFPQPTTPAVAGTSAPLTATASSHLAPIYTRDSTFTPGACEVVSDTVNYLTAGTCVINADQPGNATFAAAPRVSRTVMVNTAPPVLTPQTITFPQPTTPADAGTTTPLAATASSGLTVAYTIDPPSSSVCSLTGTTVNYLAAGSCVINADQPGDTTFAPAPQVSRTVTVNTPAPVLTPQTITFPQPTTPADAGTTTPLAATASSGLTVAYAIDPTSTGVCSLTGTTVDYLTAGACLIHADQPGDATYEPAPRVSRTVTVTTPTPPGFTPQTITFPQPTSSTPVGSVASLTATASSGLAVVYTIATPLTCSLSGTTVSFLREGICSIDADQPGNATFAAAPRVSRSVTVTAATSLTPLCDGLPATVVGTPGDEVLIGTRGDDVIVGMGGNDRVEGGAGNDRICAAGTPAAAGGSLQVDAGPGNDIVHGSAGDDSISGSSGDDTLIGGPGRDDLNGDSGNDRLAGGPGDDRLHGGSGNDELIGGPGRNQLRGGTGKDDVSD